MDPQPLVDLSPLARMALVAVLLAAVPLAWLWVRHRDAPPAVRLHRLTLLTLFLTFDLVLFGAFTRLTDSGLGCPDWPGCYGSASPLGAHDEIHAAQTAQPSGPVTFSKAWIEMIHRYLATAVGVLIIAMTVVAWRLRGRRSLPGAPPIPSPWWPTATLVWVCVQGAFGAWTVTLKLYPAIVTLHLLGGMLGLALLSAQAQAFAPRPMRLPAPLRRALWALAALVAVQIALGGWVSTNYAVLACRDFPTCQGRWWPEMDFGHAFHLTRALGTGADGGYLPFAALTAIHVTHRLMALPVLAAMVWCGLWLLRVPQARLWGQGLLAIAAWQAVSGLSNVVLGWPLAAAVAHTAGAAALVVWLSVVLTRSAQASEAASSPAPARVVPRGDAARAAP